MAVILRQASHASLAAGRAPQAFIPLVLHWADMCADRTLFQSKTATAKIKLGRYGSKQASTRRRGCCVTAWPVVPTGTAARPASQGPKVDIGARMRGMWR